MTAIRPIPDRPRHAPGFTLVELLVVIAIIGLVSAVTLPTIISAINEREVSDAAATFQSTLASARDNAARVGTSRGVRLLPDPDLTDVSRGIVVSNRMIAIESAPEYNVGRCFLRQFRYNVSGFPAPVSLLLAVEDKSYMTTSPLEGSSPTSWYWNIRLGERLKLGDSGRLYKVIGPVRTPPGPLNPEGFVNLDDPTPNTARVVSLPILTYPTGLVPPSLILATGTPATPFDAQTLTYINSNAAEYLILANGLDDDRDGFIDEQFDGIDNDGDNVADPAFGGIAVGGPAGLDPTQRLVLNHNPNPGFAFTGEYEPENLEGSVNQETSRSYTISRRPVVSEGAREVPLPANMVIDLTLADWRVVADTSRRANLFTFGSNPNNGGVFAERSRVPIDVYSTYVDVLYNPAGQVAEDQFNFNVSRENRGLSAYHFWMANREDVQAPFEPPANATYAQGRLLPTPYSANAGQTPLKKDRRMITLFTRTGDLLVNTIADEAFAAPIPNDQRTGIEAIYQPAQSGVREP